MLNRSLFLATVPHSSTVLAALPLTPQLHHRFLSPLGTHDSIQVPYLCFHLSYNGLQFGQNLLLSRWVDQLEAGSNDTPVRTRGCGFSRQKPRMRGFFKARQALDARGTCFAPTQTTHATRFSILMRCLYLSLFPSPC